MTSATLSGAVTEQDGSVFDFDAADAFLKRIEPGADKELPADAEEDENDEEEIIQEETSEEDEDTSGEDLDDESTEDGESEDQEEDEGEESEEDTKSKVADDDTLVKVKVDGKVLDVPIKDLKRLYGQEASLTRKSQEVASERKRIEEFGAKQTVALQTMIQRAQERARPYADIDFLALAKDPNITAEELTALRIEAQSAFADLNFYTQELDNVFQNAQAQRAEAMRREALEAHKVLNDPKTGIDGWSQSLYNDIRSFAVSEGLNADVVNTITDPNAIKLLHKAMLFAKGQKALASTKKVVKTPKKILKSASTETTTKAKSSKSESKPMDALRRTGSIDAAADLFFSRMTK